MIYGERIRQVRKLRRFTQKHIAERVGVKQAAISQIETGHIQPSSDVIDRIALATGFPRRFFERPPGPEVPLGSLAFRARATTSLTDVDEAHAWTELAFECAYGLASKARIRPVTLPNLSQEAPERAAHVARSTLGLGPDRPIANVTYTLEQFGIFILALPIKLVGRDAWSTWVGVNPRFPLVVVSGGSLGGRLRFTHAHEFHHLLAPDLRGNVEQAEIMADRFASEFLMPASAVQDDLRVPLNMGTLSVVAKRWGASPQAVVMRASQLGRISERRARQLYQTLSVRGFSQREPPDATVPVERPRLFRKLGEVIYGSVNGQKLAMDFDLPLDLATGLLEAHAERRDLVETVPGDEPGKIIDFPRNP